MTTTPPLSPQNTLIPNLERAILIDRNIEEARSLMRDLGIENLSDAQEDKVVDILLKSFAGGLANWTQGKKSLAPTSEETMILILDITCCCPKRAIIDKIIWRCKAEYQAKVVNAGSWSINGLTAWATTNLSGSSQKINNRHQFALDLEKHYETIQKRSATPTINKTVTESCFLDPGQQSTLPLPPTGTTTNTTTTTTTTTTVTTTDLAATLEKTQLPLYPLPLETSTTDLAATEVVDPRAMENPVVHWVDFYYVSQTALNKYIWITTNIFFTFCFRELPSREQLDWLDKLLKEQTQAPDWLKEIAQSVNHQFVIENLPEPSFLEGLYNSLHPPFQAIPIKVGTKYVFQTSPEKYEWLLPNGEPIFFTELPTEEMLQAATLSTTI